MSGEDYFAGKDAIPKTDKVRREASAKRARAARQPRDERARKPLQRQSTNQPTQPFPMCSLGPPCP
jgi:hypothetical protein